MAQIVDRERRQYQPDPGDLDWAAAEMSKVRVERLGAGHGKENGAECEQADDAVMEEKVDAIEWVDRPQHTRIAGDRHQTGDRNRHEPHHHDRAEQRRNFSGAP